MDARFFGKVEGVNVTLVSLGAPLISVQLVAESVMGFIAGAQ
jgi:hypothetical protein